jgi:hypothetical protein
MGTALEIAPELKVDIWALDFTVRFVTIGSGGSLLSVCGGGRMPSVPVAVPSNAIVFYGAT